VSGRTHQNKIVNKVDDISTENGTPSLLVTIPRAALYMVLPSETTEEESWLSTREKPPSVG